MEATAPKIVKLHIWRYPDVPADEHPWIVSEHLDNGDCTLNPPEFRTFPEALAHALSFSGDLPISALDLGCELLDRAA